ncbi:MAG: HD domain-containing protein [Verrucomicrobiales bacterium]|nr:HD domain-containing protein [Verrucomicrobiales bacterium]
MNPAAAVQEFRAAMARLEPEPTHTEHVARLAVRLFDDLRELHGFGVAERTLLEGAACLHDIGWPESRNGSGHHKISARLIRRQKWTTLSPSEVDLLAQVARYHRRAHPCSEHGDFHRLDADGKHVVRALAALLRLADALDRSHLQRVRDLKASADSRRIRLVLLAETEPAREIAACAKKGTLASEVFDREIVVEASLVP